MRIPSLAAQCGTTLVIGLLFAGVAHADGARREAPIEPLALREAPAEETQVAADAPAEAAPETPVMQGVNRGLTSCEQLRIDLHRQQRNFYQRKREDRRAAYSAMRNGDPHARYICIGTTCNGPRQKEMYHKVMMWDQRNQDLQHRLHHGPLGSSDDCHVFHLAMQEHLFRGAKYVGGKGFHGKDHHGKQSRKPKGQRQAAVADAPQDRRDPFEIELERRYQRARRTRGY